MTERGDSFPRQYARTRRFTLGQPRSFAVEVFDADFGGRPRRFGACAVVPATTALRRPRRGARAPAVSSDRCVEQ